MAGISIYSTTFMHLIEQNLDHKPTVCVWSLEIDRKHLQHVFDLFERLGFQTTDEIDSDWDVMWAHNCPFFNQTLAQIMRNLKPHQRVNKIPGNNFVTQKMAFSIVGGSFVPKSFKLPEQHEAFLEYVNKFPNKSFVEKSIFHRNVSIKALNDISKHTSEKFIQEYVANPILIGGRKFDIGVYVVITSVEPLRIYSLEGDATFRFCTEPYEPFNASILEKYVIGKDYLPAYKVREMQPYLKLSHKPKDAFDAYIRSIEKDPSAIWQQVRDAVESVYLTRLDAILPYVNKYKHKNNFFELVRFDFILDENFKVYLLEANMSPNLSSVKNSENGIRHDQTLFSTLSLVGISNFFTPLFQNENRSREMEVSKRNIMVYPEHCLKCTDCSSINCQLCEPCLTEELLNDIKATYREHKNKNRFKRLFPPKMTQEEARIGIPFRFNEKLTMQTIQIYRWFQGKCLLDDSWC
ncbi:Hypothetical predicted protein [Cloeon dipterum]|nr:Hypothetical predicted protein [Cloeon dipterum]